MLSMCRPGRQVIISVAFLVRFDQVGLEEMVGRLPIGEKVWVTEHALWSASR
jgi:hypothetical protein